MPQIIVFHRHYGCDTGCCGHAIEVDGVELSGSFDFDHPYGVNEDHLEFAKEFVRCQMGEEHVADLDWENCRVVDYC